MIVLNFAHPLTEEQILRLEEITGEKVEEIREFKVSFDNAKPFAEQVKELVDGCDMTPMDWQTKRILIVPPSLNFIAVTLIAELHGRMGYFPPIVRIRPVEGAVPPKFEVAEIIDLQAVRDRARKERTG
ncbi:hypothetical protein DRJ27_05885 [Candidatus Acetothermia bacterium]|mgnify:CR=1 FL=1|nr:MAG: hypothetical protein DRJ27_05885 [Candidatus Acetothermia bacterium]